MFCMIRLDHAEKVYQIDSETKFTALSRTTLTIKSNEFIAIIGPSGSGKSTLMYLLGLLDRPTSGKLFIENRDTGTLTDTELSVLRNAFVGFVFQQFNLIPKLTVLENVLLPTIYARTSLSFDPKKRAIELLMRFGIKEKANSYPNRLSGGQQQRTAIARALMMNPKLILADEPTGNLDSKTGGEILDLLANLNREEGHTIAIVTHDPQVAKRAKRIIKLKDGKIL
ncbi:MAG: ABC transporter ATP-binding protein [bacterium]|nr:ABC transporter ATP-binding protein [bacterium]